MKRIRITYKTGIFFVEDAYCLKGKEYRLIMCDLKKYADIYKEIKQLDPDDTLQLVLESETEEERDFYAMVGDFLLQQKQKDVIARNVF